MFWGNSLLFEIFLHAYLQIYVNTYSKALNRSKILCTQDPHCKFIYSYITSIKTRRLSSLSFCYDMKKMNVKMTEILLHAH